MDLTNERYEYRTLSEDDFDAVWTVMGDNFTNNEPLSAKLKIPVDCPQLSLHRGWKIRQALRQNASIGAYEKRSDEIVGCALLDLSWKTAEENSPANLYEAPLNFRQLHKFLSSCMEGMTEILGKEDYIELTFLTCRKDHSGKGIATKLVESAVDVARKANCKKILIQSFNYYVHRIAEKNGFEYLKEIFYSDYVDPLTGTKPFTEMPQPHVKGALLMKRLSD